MLLMPIFSSRYVLSAQSPTSIVVHSSPCLVSNYSSEMRRLVYPNGDMQPVRIAYSHRTTAMINQEIAYIILSEVMNYSTEFFDTQTIVSAHTVNYASGCEDPDDTNCTERRVEDPPAHIAIEAWRDGMVRAAQLPLEVQPVPTAVLDFTVTDQVRRRRARPPPARRSRSRCRPAIPAA